jgi:hypothetical protein
VVETRCAGQASRHVDDALLVADELRRGGIEATPGRVYSAAGLQAALAEEAPEIVIVDHNLRGSPASPPRR